MFVDFLGVLSFLHRVHEKAVKDPEGINADTLRTFHLLLRSDDSSGSSCTHCMYQNQCRLRSW
jgi:hypothetical protein